MNAKKYDQKSYSHAVFTCTVLACVRLCLVCSCVGIGIKFQHFQISLFLKMTKTMVYRLVEKWQKIWKNEKMKFWNFEFLKSP